MSGELPYKDLSETPTELFGAAVAFSLFYVGAWLFGSTLVSTDVAESQLGAPQSLVTIAGSRTTIYFVLLLILALGGACIYALYQDATVVRQRTEWNPPIRLYLTLAVAAVTVDFIIGAPLLALVVGMYAIHRRRSVGW